MWFFYSFREEKKQNPNYPVDPGAPGKAWSI
jgi:hypothetical protein